MWRPLLSSSPAPLHHCTIAPTPLRRIWTADWSGALLLINCRNCMSGIIFTTIFSSACQELMQALSLHSMSSRRNPAMRACNHSDSLDTVQIDWNDELTNLNCWTDQNILVGVVINLNWNYKISLKRRRKTQLRLATDSSRRCLSCSNEKNRIGTFGSSIHARFVKRQP